MVFLHVTDPVGAGVVESLAHPGRNITGFIALGNAPTKEVELFKQLVPGLHRLLVLSDPDDPGVPVYRREVRQVGTALKFQLVERAVRSQTDLERVFASLSRGGVDGVFIASLNLRVKFHALILRLAAEGSLPVAGHRKEWVAQGALFYYGVNYPAIGEAAARRLSRTVLP